MMEYPTHSEGPFVVISLTGEVDMNYSPQARQQILAHLDGQRHVLVDLSQVSYIDSSGVASLVEGLQKAKSSNLRFGLVGASRASMLVLRLARLDRVFPLYGTLEDALGKQA